MNLRQLGQILLKADNFMGWIIEACSSAASGLSFFSWFHCETVCFDVGRGFLWYKGGRHIFRGNWTIGLCEITPVFIIETQDMAHKYPHTHHGVTQDSRLTGLLGTIRVPETVVKTPV